MIGPFSGEYRFLSNFYPCSVKAYDLTFPSVEHAYQASKTFDINVREHILKMTAGEAKRFGRSIPVVPNWDDQRIMVMEELVRRKFYGDYELAQKLIATGEEELVEVNTWRDCFWGEYEGSGLNHLGKILMQIRDEIKSREITNWC